LLLLHSGTLLLKLLDVLLGFFDVFFFGNPVSLVLSLHSLVLLDH
jgi:hypothetical protein